MAANFGSTPRWFRPTFTIQPTILCSGMWCAFLTRLKGQLESAIGLPIKGFRNRTRAARRRMQALQRMTPTQRKTHQRKKYRELIGIAEEVVESARQSLR